MIQLPASSAIQPESGSTTRPANVRSVDLRGGTSADL